MEEKKKVWICPADGTYNSGKFCIRCGKPRPVTEDDAEKESMDTAMPSNGMLAEAPAEPVSDGLKNAEPEERKDVHESPVLTHEPDGAEDTEEIREEAVAESSELSAFDRIRESFGDLSARINRNETVRELQSDRKKRITVIISVAVAAVLLFLLFALLIAPKFGVCILGHRWQPASCLRPMTCSVCGKTKGETVSHSFAPATCTEPYICTVCGAASGMALGHVFRDATCTASGACARCGETKGEPKGHVPGEKRIAVQPTAVESGVEETLCAVCGEVMVTEDCYLDSFVEGDAFTFTVREYNKLLVAAKEAVLPEVRFVVITSEEDGSQCFGLWLDLPEIGEKRVATGKLYNGEFSQLTIDENDGIKPALICWDFADREDTETIKTLLPFILYTVSPGPIDGETLLREYTVESGGLWYCYDVSEENCRVLICTPAIAAALRG